jgi:flagellar biosynthesis/type III secretory pathway M-ring protein FliF/YscJ
LNTRQLILFLVLLITACQNNENREYIHWSKAEESVIKRLDNGTIDYKIENGNVYIPKDQLKKATVCCS